MAPWKERTSRGRDESSHVDAHVNEHVCSIDDFGRSSRQDLVLKVALLFKGHVSSKGCGAVMVFHVSPSVVRLEQLVCISLL